MNLKISTAWKAAGADLGVRVIAPYEVRTGPDDVVVCEAFLPDFGSPTGAVILGYDSASAVRARLAGRWCSVLHKPYEHYDRALFIETLDDWGWFGSSYMEQDWRSRARTS